MKVKQYKNSRKKRHARVRGKVSGTKNRPRLSIFRSNTYIYAQLVDDSAGKTLVAASDLSLDKKRKDLSKVDIAKEVGKLLGEKALKNKIKKIVFDRGGYKYHGRVKALADGAREAGLVF